MKLIYVPLNLNKITFYMRATCNSENYPVYQNDTFTIIFISENLNVTSHKRITARFFLLIMSLYAA